MAATQESILGQFATPQGGPSTVAGAFPQVGGPVQNIDLLQIVDEGGSVLINVDYAGTVHNPSSGATGNNTRCGQFKSSIASGTTAAIFAATFLNPANSDILQTINPGGNVAYYLDYLGVAHGS